MYYHNKPDYERCADMIDDDEIAKEMYHARKIINRLEGGEHSHKPSVIIAIAWYKKFLAALAERK